MKAPIYLDHAATTPLAPEVWEAMQPYALNHFGNPSSTHQYGQRVRVAIEQVRQQIALGIGAEPGQIYFTSSGTEANNWVFTACSDRLTHVITSQLEHAAVLRPLEALAKQGKIQVHFVQLNAIGEIQLDSLEALLTKYPKALVSLMQGNNEIGNRTNLSEVSALCQQHGALLHTDSVQTLGKYIFHAPQLGVDFCVGSAHKFHGPKGIGFLYAKDPTQLHPLLYGGGQERGLRGGTEAVLHIVGLGAAWKLSQEDQPRQLSYLQALKQQLKNQLQRSLPECCFHGVQHPDQSLPHILSIGLPILEDQAMLLVNLDTHGIAVAGSSACSSGSTAPSPVLQALGIQHPVLRVSFSRYTTPSMLEAFTDTLRTIVQHMRQ